MVPRSRPCARNAPIQKKPPVEKHSGTIYLQDTPASLGADCPSQTLLCRCGNQTSVRCSAQGQLRTCLDRTGSTELTARLPDRSTNKIKHDQINRTNESTNQWRLGRTWTCGAQQSVGPSRADAAAPPRSRSQILRPECISKQCESIKENTGNIFVHVAADKTEIGQGAVNRHQERNGFGRNAGPRVQRRVPQDLRCQHRRRVIRLLICKATTKQSRRTRRRRRWEKKMGEEEDGGKEDGRKRRWEKK